jgi:small subunit ribosomal protein S8
MNDPIADLLTRVRNAVHAGLRSVDIPSSSIKREICRVLKEEGFIDGFEYTEESIPGIIRVSLKYLPNRKPVLQGIKRVSKPSLRVYVGGKEIKPVRSGLGVAILSTPKGVMTGRQARENKVGGEVICEVW